MTPTESKILERVIEINPNSRYVAVVSSADLDQLNDAIPHFRDLLSSWWLSGAKFLILGRVDGIDVVFHKVEAEDNEDTLR